MSALSLKTQVEEERKKKVKVGIYFYALTVSGGNTSYKMFRYKGMNDNKPSNIFLFKKNLRFYLSL